MFLLLVADATYGSGCIIDVINSNDLFTQTQLQGITKHHCSLDDLKCPSPQAYSVYDEEIGYCQGQSFLAAVLLLHVSRRVVFPLSEDVYSIFYFVLHFTHITDFFLPTNVLNDIDEIYCIHICIFTSKH